MASNRAPPAMFGAAPTIAGTGRRATIHSAGRLPEIRRASALCRGAIPPFPRFVAGVPLVEVPRQIAHCDGAETCEQQGLRFALV